MNGWLSIGWLFFQKKNIPNHIATRTSENGEHRRYVNMRHDSENSTHVYGGKYENRNSFVAADNIAVVAIVAIVWCREILPTCHSMVSHQNELAQQLRGAEKNCENKFGMRWFSGISTET